MAALIGYVGANWVSKLGANWVSTFAKLILHPAGTIAYKSTIVQYRRQDEIVLRNSAGSHNLCRWEVSLGFRQTNKDRLIHHDANDPAL
jgi:L-asparaginase/Glu-tRNA(Gln) amidotransferase subunit D